MKARRVPLEQRIQRLPLTKVFIVTVLIWLPMAVYLLNNFKQLDPFTFLVFSPFSSILIVWGIIYFVALLIGYGITNTPTYPGAITLKNMELVKPKYAVVFERILLLIICMLFITLAILLLGISLFIN